MATSTQPLVVSIMGQSGVGKTSLVNALFKADLATDPIFPCTKEPQCITHTNASGEELQFYDLAGIGEQETDGLYLASYRERLLTSDVVLWAFHADSRSVSYDRASLLTLLTGFDRQTQMQLVNKITCVLTKADLLVPPAWQLNIIGPNQGVFVPPSHIETRLEQKARYIWETLFAGYNGEVQHPSPHRVIPSSSRFHYNLDRLMIAVLERLEHNAVARFGQFFKSEALNCISLEEATSCCNLILFDQKKRFVVFDLREAKL